MRSSSWGGNMPDEESHTPNFGLAFLLSIPLWLLIVGLAWLVRSLLSSVGLLH